jgi:formylglycine-generating enzyme required for sulfatase activity
MADIFISYKREDRARIAPLARALEARGYTVWWDLELIAGQKWSKKIKAELDAAKCVVVAWTRASVAEDRTYASEWIENEADDAHRRGVLVPALLDEGRIAWVHQRIQFATLTDWNGDAEHPGFADLLEGIKQHAGVRATPEAVELAAWTQAERAETAEAFQGFLSAFPQSRFAEIARGRVAELEEAAVWSALGSAPTIAALAGFLRRYPTGRFADEAEAKIKALELASARHGRTEPQSAPAGHQPSAAPSFRLPRWAFGVGAVVLALVVVLIWQPWRPGESASNDPASIEQGADAADATPTESAVTAPPEQARVQEPEPEAAPPVQTRADQPIPLPEMVRIPGRNFEVGRFEVTFAQWDACVAGGGCNGYRPNDAGWGRGSRPVINVSWNDAQAYVQWLSQRTGQRYRLLTSAEWEYAARAGTTTNFSWGDEDPVCDQSARNGANFSDCTGNRTRPVGSFQPNAFGLYDAHGNVWEWVEDCYDGSCSSRVLRGGSWNLSPGYLRSAYSSRDAPSLRSDGVLGFRVARTVS